MSGSIDYGNLMHRAMRSLIQEVLSDVADNGLPGAHHFFITFDTTHPETELAEWLKDRYPSEMTVVMQHWYDNLEVGDTGFGITLNFGDAPEHMFIPYNAIKTFVDPSVEFGLRFETQVSEEDEDPTPPDPPRPLRDPSKVKTPSSKSDTNGQEAHVVRLDQFRK